MIRREDVVAAVAGGLSFVCAMCTKHWSASAHGEGCRLPEVGGCGGPLAGLAFPAYEGALEGHLSMVCFVCGQDSTKSVEVLGRGIVGVCDGHVEMLSTFSRRGTRPPAKKAVLPLRS